MPFGSPPSAPCVWPRIVNPLPSAATSMLASVNDVANEALRLADCLEGFHPDAAAGLRETFELLGLDGDRLRRAVEERTTGS